MTADTFIDTNVLLYLVSASEHEVDKRATARRLLAGSGWELSVHVVQESYVNVVRPPRCAMTHADAAARSANCCVAPRWRRMRPWSWRGCA